MGEIFASFFFIFVLFGMVIDKRWACAERRLCKRRLTRSYWLPAADVAVLVQSCKPRISDRQDLRSSSVQLSVVSPVIFRAVLPRKPLPSEH